MNDAMLSFLEIVKACVPYSLAWSFGIMAYNYVVGAITGKDVILK